MTDTTQPAGRMQWTDEQHEAYALGMQTEREHQNALSRLVMEKHAAELATLQAENARLAEELESERNGSRIHDANLTGELAALMAELAALRAEARWEPVPNGEYSGVHVIDDDVIGIRWWDDMGDRVWVNRQLLPDVRLCRLVPGQDGQQEVDV